ncbi:MAG: COX15/CtaA family protein, partial [Gammaproteobacteria bacterium]
YELPKRAQLGFHLLAAMVMVQVTLGIVTLLLHVPVFLATTHQGGALILFTIALFTNHALKKADRF